MSLIFIPKTTTTATWYLKYRKFLCTVSRFYQFRFKKKKKGRMKKYYIRYSFEDSIHSCMKLIHYRLKIYDCSMLIEERFMTVYEKHWKYSCSGVLRLAVSNKEILVDQFLGELHFMVYEDAHFRDRNHYRSILHSHLLWFDKTNSHL